MVLEDIANSLSEMLDGAGKGYLLSLLTTALRQTLGIISPVILMVFSTCVIIRTYG